MLSGPIASKMLISVLLLCIVFQSAAGVDYDSRDECNVACSTTGREYGECAYQSSTSKYRCSVRCQPGYFTEAQKESSCEDECDEMYWSLFTYGSCADLDTDKTPGTCTRVCGWRVRVWTTVFIFVLFAAAVVILIFIVPICATSCRACVVGNKERTARKKGPAHAGADYASYEDGRPGSGQAMTATKGAGGAGPPAVYQNPYMYWPYYGRAG